MVRKLFKDTKLENWELRLKIISVWVQNSLLKEGKVNRMIYNKKEHPVCDDHEIYFSDSLVWGS